MHGLRRRRTTGNLLRLAALGVADRFTRCDMIEATEGERVAFLGLADLGGGRADHARQRGDAVFAAIGAEHGRTVGEGAAQNAHDRQLAAVRRVHRAHGLTDRRTRIGDAEARARLRDRRGLVAQGLQQARDAIAALGRADQHRHDMAVAQFAREIVEHLIARRLDVGNQFLHQRVVVIGQLFQHRVPRFFFTRQIAGGHVDDGRGRMFAVDEGAFEREVDEAGGDAVLPDRDLAQEQWRARGGLQNAQRLVHALRGGVDLVEEDEAGNA